ncbi:TIR domain-containing protein [Paraburkholderia caribensis]|uniref:TIR domain-containing protein n=1 Tax=Paraburkholderia caribensis TaxID=75105 RepID=UPI0034D187C8
MLDEQSGRGATIIEKFEREANHASYAVVLLTPDDKGGAFAASTVQLRPRARQNVILELGYFAAKLGRGHVCALRQGDVEIPSDFNGVQYLDYDAAGAWKTALARELRDAGLGVNMNHL